MTQTLGPLILGASGRIGQMWQTLWQDGHWPGRDPVWHGRVQGDVVWDMLNDPAPNTLPPCHGVIVLAGRTTGTEAELAQNSTLARAALDLAKQHALGPVLLCSSSAVYGAAPGPHSETSPTTQPNAYGAAKLAMEQAAAAHDTPSCALRIANVAGCDMALINAAKGPLILDQFPDGTTPNRLYAGVLTLARMMTVLLNTENLPPVLNLAQPGLIAMGDLLDAAGAQWIARLASDTALPALSLDLTELAALIPLDPACPDTLVAEARLAGWRPA